MPKDLDPTPIDDENPPLSRETILAMRPASEVLPSAAYTRLVADQDDRARASQATTLTLDPDVVERLSAMDDDWRGQATALLRKAVGL